MCTGHKIGQPKGMTDAEAQVRHMAGEHFHFTKLLNGDHVPQFHIDREPSTRLFGLWFPAPALMETQFGKLGMVQSCFNLALYGAYHTRYWSWR